MTAPIRFAFAGDRDISVWVVDFLLKLGWRPLALLVPAPGRATHSDELGALCAFLAKENILKGTAFREARGIVRLSMLDLDYIICVHFPYIIPPEVLALPKLGVLNLHPAYLPHNRGWHTPSWAILNETPIGATLHFMDEGIDTGDIVHQKMLSIRPNDTADSLYRRIKQLELEVFQGAWPEIASGSPPRRTQNPEEGTFHKRDDLGHVQPIDLDAPTTARDLLRRLRALTTNRLDEAAYFEESGKRYRIQIAFHEDNAND